MRDALEDSLRDMELSVLQSMYSEEELCFPAPKDNPYEFELLLKLILCNDSDSVEEERPVQLRCSFPEAHPFEAMAISVTCEGLKRDQHDAMRAALQNELTALEDEEMRVLCIVDWLREHLYSYLSREELVQGVDDAVDDNPESDYACGATLGKGFMREWCSFASLYKDSYISGPNRFEVMCMLATERGLGITGMGISGKPGGLVVEGEEKQVVRFMELMRTEFFETLNPRGRKLTTRLQDRWPFDQEQERYETAEVVMRFEDDIYRTADREAGIVQKAGEASRLEAWEVRDKAALCMWRARSPSGRRPGPAHAARAATPWLSSAARRMCRYVDADARSAVADPHQWHRAQPRARVRQARPAQEPRMVVVGNV